MKPYDETHQVGYLSIEQDLKSGMIEGDVGIQVAEDGRIWVCLNGQSLLRFKPSSEAFRRFMKERSK
jgi:streptogramin lyase